MIELKNISKTYRIGNQELRAVDNVSLKIETGEFVVIMGSSGSGKSTLMHIMGLLDKPDSGEYLFSGEDVTRLTEGQLASFRNRLFGFIFQQFYLFQRMTALRNVEVPLIYAGQRNIQDKVRQKLSAVGLGDRMMHRPNELSGGQQQRTAIARALVNEPLIVLADEPTGNLDTKSKDEIIAILKDLNSQGKTIVMVTHEPEMASHANRVIRMRDGRIVSDERYQTAKTQPDASPSSAAIKEAISISKKSYDPRKILDSIRQAMAALVSNKLRSLLSVLGILIGVAVVIAMLELGHSTRESIEEKLSSLGANLLIVSPGKTKVQGVLVEAATTRLNFADLNAVSQIPYVKGTSAYVVGRGQVVYGSKNTNAGVEGVDVSYATIRASEPTSGRFFTEEELQSRAKVAVIGSKVAKDLFEDSDPVGESIKINKIKFKVIGIMPSKGGSASGTQDNVIVLPVTTAMYRLLGKEYIDVFFVEAASAEIMTTLQQDIKDVLLKMHRLNKQENKKDAFEVLNMSEIKSTIDGTIKTLTLFLGSIAAISLFVGGIGIMNIMLVSVTERTKEIGICKAIGATRRDILQQFLVESVVMTLIGGLIGIILGEGISWVIISFAKMTLKVHLSSVLLATAFSMGVGIVFGLWPAVKASRLNPIDALRYE